MKQFSGKYLYLLIALGALGYALLCHFKQRPCIDPVTTYDAGGGSLLIEPDSTIAGVTQIEVKVTALDSSGTILVDTVLLPGASVLASITSEFEAVQVKQRYLNGTTQVAEETDNFRTAGIIIGVDVVIKPITEPSDPYYDDFIACCSTLTTDAGTDVPALAPYNFHWGSLGGQVNVLGVTITGGGTTAKFVLIYDPTLSNSQPMLYGPCTPVPGSSFTNCEGALTTMFHSPNLNFSLRFYKINAGSDMEVAIVPTNACTIGLRSCNGATTSTE